MAKNNKPQATAPATEEVVESTPVEETTAPVEATTEEVATEEATAPVEEAAAEAKAAEEAKNNAGNDADTVAQIVASFEVSEDGKVRAGGKVFELFGGSWIHEGVEVTRDTIKDNPAFIEYLVVNESNILREIFE